MLSSAIKNAKLKIGASDIGENYSGFMASFGLYDYALTLNEIVEILNKSQPAGRNTQK